MTRIAFVGMLLLVGCQYNGTEEDKDNAKAEMADNASRSEAHEKTTKLPDRPMAEEYVRPGFAVYEQEGRLWVFKPGSEGHVEFLTEGAPEKRITLIGAGPDRKTILGTDRATLDSYRDGVRYGRPGFAVFSENGRLWVFREGSEGLEGYVTEGAPEKRITLIGAGPERKTILGTDRATLDSYRDGVRYGLPGFAVFGENGRLWVFREGSAGLEEYLTEGAPEKRVTLIGAGPGRRTLLGTDREAIADYCDSWKFAREGYVVIAREGRLWVFRENSEGLHEFMTEGAPEKRITLIGAGPGRRTLLGTHRETLNQYVVLTRYGHEGFKVVPSEGRLWVFREGTKDYEEFLKEGEPEKRITLIGAGPDRKTLLGTDREVLDEYVAATRYGAPGFRVFAEGGRLWVFREGSAGLMEYLEKGEPEKRITLIGAGPDRKTLLGTERETLDAYLAARRSMP